MLRLSEILGTLRCLRMARGVLAMYSFFRDEGRSLLNAVDEQVMVYVRAAVADPGRRARIRAAFQTSAVKYGAGVWAYSRMVRMPFRADLVALSAAFTRLYDDLMDLHADEGVDDRFGLLFAGGNPRPEGELEDLAYRLYRAADRLAGRAAADSIYEDLRRAHGWQVRSRRQRGTADVSAAELMDITSGKGGLGIVVLFGLAHPGITAEQRELLVELGVVGQMLDDQHDLPVDRLDGIRTPATTGHLGAWALAGRTARLGQRLRHALGREAAPMEGLYFLYQMGLVFRRRRIVERYAPVASTPWKILTGRMHDIPPAAASSLH